MKILRLRLEIDPGDRSYQRVQDKALNWTERREGFDEVGDPTMR